MRYYVRVAIGLVLGAIAVAVCWSLALAWWLAAAGGALAAIVGFLATFFVWNADRLEEGYEQVLFDGRNVTHVLVLAVLLAGAAFGSTLIGSGEEEAPVDPAVAALNEDHSALVKLFNAVQAGELDADGVAAARVTLDEVKAHLDAQEESEKGALLVKAQGALVEAVQAYEDCGAELCQLATLSLLDAKAPLNKYTES